MNTEAEASKLWCPMARVVMPSNNTANRVSAPMLRIAEGRDKEYFLEQADNCNCIASQCAMWRWDQITGPENGERRWKTAQNHIATTEDEAGPKPPWCEGWAFCCSDMDPAGWIEPEEASLVRRTGYCGLAGKPGVAA